VTVLTGQGLALPLINPGVPGEEFMVTAKFRGDEEPHVLFAVTETLPDVELEVTVMEFVVELPVQPAGIVQVYEVAPFTVAME
jgi:hypothetical protein